MHKPIAGLISSSAQKALVLVLCLLPLACSHKARVSPPRGQDPPIPSVPNSRTKPPAITASVPAAPPVTREKTSIPHQPIEISPRATVKSVPSPGPLIRIGLTVSAGDVRISAARNYYLLEKRPEAQKEAVRGEVRVRIERGDDASSEVFRVQVASLSSMEGARNLQDRLSELFSLPVFIREGPGTGLKQVRLGAFGTRGEAQNFATGTLAAGGFRDSIVVRETAPVETGDPVLALRGDSGLFRISRSGFLLFPAPEGGLLQYEGKSYRGFLDLSINKDGRITVVNELGIEEYLLGVVPAELNPSRYPEYAALAAQSIAARTYALKNKGRFRSDGFDLTADVRTQVYGGASMEKPPSSEAVQDTAGLAIYYQNSLIDAMYTSTCGGRTEDFANVFDAQPVPYLRSVSCSIESKTDEIHGLRLQGKRALRSYFAEDGAAVTRNLELAAILGLTDPTSRIAEYTEPATQSEIRRWVERACTLAGKVIPPSELRGHGLDKRSGFLRFAAELFFGATEITHSVSAADVKYYLGNLKDGDEVPEASRRALVYVMQRGLCSPYPDNTFQPNTPVRRGDALSALMRWIESVRPEILKGGQYSMAEKMPSSSDGAVRSILVRWNEGSRSFPLSPDLPLFKIADGKSTPAENLEIIGNEKLRFHLSKEGRIDFLEVELNPTGASSDRFSPMASWQVTIPQAELARKIAALSGSIGTINALEPARIGNSGRVVQIQIVGSRGRTLVNGYKFRNALGLRDTLFTIVRAQNPDGTTESFTFNGRGWGHGVGLCQVGAVGMARAGRSYEEILKTYYQGVEIRKAY